MLELDDDPSNEPSLADLGDTPSPSPSPGRDGAGDAERTALPGECGALVHDLVHELLLLAGGAVDHEETARDRIVKKGLISPVTEPNEK